ncbi:hypothetical protein KA005_26365 [bacterium]|nr:hypothetical protein [bacterium]
MKKLFVVLTAMAFVMAMSLPAMAEMHVTGTAEKTKINNVTETVDIDKEIFVIITQDEEPTHSAQAGTVKNDFNEGNIVNEGKDIDPTATIDGGAFDTAAGIVSVNQAPGNLNNQGNATAIAYSADGDAFLHAQSVVEKENTGNVMNPELDVTDPLGGTERINTITGSLGGVKGIVGINQSTGCMNNQDNATSMAIGLGSMAAISEADLGMVNTMNISNEALTTKTDTITGALVASAGIIGINQSSGCMNNQANVVGVCVATASVSGL